MTPTWFYKTTGTARSEHSRCNFWLFHLGNRYGFWGTNKNLRFGWHECQNVCSTLMLYCNKIGHKLTNFIYGDIILCSAYFFQLLTWCSMLMILSWLLLIPVLIFKKQTMPGIYLKYIVMKKTLLQYLKTDT